MVKKLLVIGDSFSASSDPASWVNYLGNYVVHNESTNGSSEYRFIKKIDTANATKYDRVIFVHTSPNRIYVEKNPYYTTSSDHKNCDLIYQDVCSRLPDYYATQVSWWFENIFDVSHAKFTHSLLLDYAVQHIPNALHLTFFDYDHDPVINLHKIWKDHPGKINHMSQTGNQLVAEFVKNRI